MKIEFDQICALVIFIACCLLLSFNIDGEVKSAMTVSVGYMIGSGVQGRKKVKGGK